MLGFLVKDKISGFQGIAYATSTYLNGCSRVLIEPTKLKEDGSVLSSEWFDIQQVEIIGEAIDPKKTATGGPQKDSVRSKSPTNF